MEYSNQKTQEAAAALQKFIAKKDEDASSKTKLFEDIEDPAHTLYLNIITKKYASDKKSLKPKRILLKHSIYPSEENVSVCMISKDPQRKYKDALLEEIPVLKRVIGVSKFKGKFKSYESKRLLRSEHDIFVAEDSVITSLPKLLGKIFYDSKKIPLSIKVGGEEINAKKVKSQIDGIINSTILQLTLGTTVSVKIGYTSMAPEQIAENAEAVLNYFTEKVKPWTAIRSVQVKTATSPSLPVFITDKLHDETDLIDETQKDKKRKREDTKSIIEQAWEDILDDESLEEYKKKHKKSQVVEAN